MQGTSIPSTDAYSPAVAALKAAGAAMAAHRWSEAANLLASMGASDPGIAIKLRVSRNLASMQLHRPSVYRALLALPPDTRYSIGPAAGGRPSIFATRDDGARICLSPNHDPVGAAQNSLKSLMPTIEQGQPIACCGIGDGYLLQLLAMHPPRLFMDMQQPVFFIESDLQVLLQCLMIHDYSGPAGPIEQRRFLWFVGADWEQQLFTTFSNDPYLPCPTMTACQGLSCGRMSAAIERLVQELLVRDREVQARVESHYATVDAQSLVAQLGVDASRRPRVLIMTTRFSTVLQYSSRDVQNAFEQMGWETRLLIEPSPVHRLLNHASRRALDEFHPDVVFQIDHLRYEHGDLFPPNLPFVCWIQDHLPNLRTQRAAASMTMRDFILTDSPAMYAGTFAYPSRQCIGLTKLTRSPEVHASPGAHTAPVEDMVFVSNASHIPARIVAEHLDGYVGSPAGKLLLERCAARLIGIYEAGESVGTYHEILELIRAVRVSFPALLATDELDAIAAWLAHPLNDALYRQQALQWAAGVAMRMGLSLGLYGKGWEQHPALARFARGPIAYGPELASLTRRARFNLQIVPYHCLHQRLLDGLGAGGFYLIRAHTSDLDTQALLDFVCRHCPDATTAPVAMQMLPSVLHTRFQQLAERARPGIATSDEDDPVQAVQQWAQMGLLNAGGQVLPRFDLTSFNNAESLQAAIARFAADPKLRDELQTAQRRHVLGQFTYEAGMRRVIGGLHQRLAAEAAFSEGTNRRAG